MQDFVVLEFDLFFTIHSSHFTLYILPLIFNGVIYLENGPNMDDGIPDMAKPIVVFDTSQNSNNCQLSLCEPYREFIEESHLQGKSATRIYQELVAQTDYPRKYNSVKRFVNKIKN